MTEYSNDDEARVDDAWRTQQEIEGADLSGDRDAAIDLLRALEEVLDETYDKSGRLARDTHAPAPPRGRCAVARRRQRPGAARGPFAAWGQAEEAMSATVVALRPQAEAFAEQTGRMDTLATLERASALLQEVRTIQDAKQIHDVAKAARVYAKEQRLGREVMAKARAVACEALRRIGELLNETERNIGTRGQLVGPGIIGPSQSEGPIETPLTLAELGIDYKTSSIAQKLFALPLARFEDIRDGRNTLAEVDAAAKRAADFRATSTLSSSAAPPTPPRFASAPAPNCSPPRAGDA